MIEFKIAKIETTSDISEKESNELVKRLYELGLYPGLTITIIGRVSFGAVTIIQYGATKLALNQQEMSCLYGH